MRTPNKCAGNDYMSMTHYDDAIRNYQAGVKNDLNNCAFRLK